MLRRLLAVALFVALAAAPAAAYIVFLKDGSQMIAKEKYRVVGDKAIIVLQNGTSTSIAANEIDVARTEEVNRSRYGSAMLLEEGKVTTLTQATPPPPRPRLGDLIQKDQVGLRNLPEARRPSNASSASSKAKKTLAGYDDLMRHPQTPYRNTDVATTLAKAFQGQGFEEVKIFQGTSPARPLLEVATASEASVFRALLTSAQALLASRQAHGGAVEAVEVVLSTPSGSRAGQFLLTPDQASDLMNRRVDVTTFYVDNVQF